MRALLLLLLLPSVFALGIAQDYHENNTIIVQLGVPYQHRVNVQNDLPVPLDVNFTVSGQYMSVNGKNSSIVTLPASSTDTYVIITIDAPSTAAIGDEYRETFSVTPLLNSSGPIGLRFRLSDNFLVIVGKKVVKPVDFGPYWVAGEIVVLLAIGVLLWKSRPKKPQIPKGAFVTRKGYAQTVKELSLLVERMGPKEMAEHLEENNTRMAEWVFKKTKDPEKYHHIKTAKTKEQLVRRLS